MKKIFLLFLSLSGIILMGCAQQNNNPSQILFLNHNENANGSTVTLNTINPDNWIAEELLRFSNTESTIADTPIYVVLFSLSVSPNLKYAAWITYPDEPMPLQHGELSVLNIESQEETYIDTMVTSSTSNGIHWSPDSKYIAYCSFDEDNPTEVMLFEVATNSLLYTGIHDAACSFITWDYIGKHLAIPLEDNRIIIYDAREQRVSDTIDVRNVSSILGQLHQKITEHLV